MISIDKWVRNRFRVEAAQNLLLALISMVAGLLVLAITFLFTYAIVWFCINFGASAMSQLLDRKPLHITHAQIFIACSVFLGLLFIGNARTSREYLSSYTLSHPAPPYLVLATGIGGSLLSLLANPSASGKMITDILYSGPRLIVGSLKALLRSAQCMAVDTSGCARALTFLQQSHRRVECSDLAEQLAGHNAVKVFSQLHGLNGVVFLDTDPPAVTLTDELRENLLRS
jgi:hypothetical protein